MSLPTRVRDLGLNLLVMVASLVFFFGLAEGLARLAGYAPYAAQADVFRQWYERTERAGNEMYTFSPSRAWDLRPGFVGYHPGWGKRRESVISVNSQGRRDNAVSFKKPAGTYRIAILGDSVTFGWAVEAKDTFATQLEWNLNARSSSLHYEVLNFGVPGYGTWQELSALEEKTWAYAPDLVILAFVMNDIHDNNQAAGRGYVSMAQMQGVAKFLREHSAFYRFMRQKVLSVETQVVQRDPCVGADLRFCWEPTRQLLDQMVFTTRQHGAKFVLVIFPKYPQTVTPDPAVEAHYQQLLTAYAREKGISAVDLLKAFTENRGDLFLEGDDLHLSEIGHSIAAIEMLEQLDAQGMLPPS